MGVGESRAVRAVYQDTEGPSSPAHFRFAPVSVKINITPSVTQAKVNLPIACSRLELQLEGAQSTVQSNSKAI